MPRVNPDILKWARETAGLSVETAAGKLAIGKARGAPPPARLAAYEAGKEEPGRRLLVRMSKVYRRPLVVFYMAERPPMGDRGEDFRTLPEGHVEADDVLLDALLRDVRARQSMVRALLEGDDDDLQPVDFIGSANMDDGVPALVEAIRQTLGVELADYRREDNPEAAFALLRRATEQAGVFVLLIGNLGSHHTNISVETFRGLALADRFAPFVVINDQDAKPAWSFSLLHELAHLWLGETGVSGAYGEMETERFCNEVAGEFLLPASEVESLDVNNNTEVDDATARISEFAGERHLSRSMVAYKLYLTDAINREAWMRLRDAFLADWHREREARRARGREAEGGPNYYVVRRHRLGAALVDLVRRTMSDGTLTPSKAGKVLGVKPTNVATLLATRAPVEQ